MVVGCEPCCAVGGFAPVFCAGVPVGAASFVTGTVVEVAAGAFTTDLCPLAESIHSPMDVTMNKTALIVVSLDRTLAVPRGPKAVWLPTPPKAPARSAALPD